jgi:RNA polymerase sigma factor (sigma-70 family)
MPPGGHAQPSGGESLLTDAELLAAYRASRSADLFAQIYARHGGMVYRTGRRLTGNRQDAEDVAQAVFSLLAQRPERVTHNLGGWLHEVARNTALKLRRARGRRARREQAVAQMKGDQAAPGEDDLRDLREEIDAALARLQPALREAVVLRYLEGRPQEESARIAGCPRGTLARRAAEGLEGLRTILTQRGVGVTPTLLLAFLGREAAAAAPASLAGAAGPAGADIWGSIGSAPPLRKGAARAVVWTPVKTCAVGGIVAVGLAVGTVLAVNRWPTEGPAVGPPPPPPTRAAAPAVPVVAPFAPTGGRDLGLAPEAGMSFMFALPKVAGSHQLAGGVLAVNSSGMDLWGASDSAYFVYRKLTGDGTIRARLLTLPATGTYAKAGVMVRGSLDPDAANVFLGRNVGTDGLIYQVRPRPKAETKCPGGRKAGLPCWSRLVRRGHTVTGSVSHDGTTWEEVSSQTIDLGKEVFFGLAVTSHKEGVVNTSTFDQVTLTTGR